MTRLFAAERPQTREAAQFSALALDRALRPQRALLSVATVALLAIGGTSGGLEVGIDAKIVVGTIALVNLAWNAILLSVGSPAEDRRVIAFAQIAVDAFLALTAIAVVDAQSTPLAWILLLAPVLDAAARYGFKGALVAWVLVSMSYISVLLAFSTTDASSGDLLSTAVQQVAAVVATVGPILMITSRLRSDLESTTEARTRADDQKLQLRQVSFTAQQMSSAMSPEHVLQLAVDATLQLGFARADVCQKRSGERWVMKQSSGTPHAPDAGTDELLVRAMTLASVASAGVSEPTVDELQRLHALGYASAFAIVTQSSVGEWLGIRAFSETTIRENSAVFESLEALSSHTAAAWTNTSVRQSLRGWSQQLEHQAMHDSLTGLPNRAYLLGHLRQQIPLAPPRSLAVLFLDLNGFKLVNDTSGHEAGDLVLRTIAQRVTSLIGPEDMFARLGGDEFVVCVAGRQHEELHELAGQIMAAIERPIELEDGHAYVGTSIGVAVHEGEDVAALLHRADQAMYHAKQVGKAKSTSSFTFASAVGVS